MTNHDPQPSSKSLPKGRAAEQAGGVTDEIKGAAGDMAREARAAGEAVRQEVSNLGGTIKQGLSDQVERQKNGIADRLSAVAERAQTSASDLRTQEAWLGNLLGRGADELAGIAEEIRRNDVPGLLGSVEVFARRQPALFMGATVALGFALTRFIGGGPTDADTSREHIGRSDYSRPDLGRPHAGGIPQARRPMVDPVVGGSI
jgi:hypothetical protein